MVKSKALKDLDALFARIDLDPDLCDPCKADMAEPLKDLVPAFSRYCECSP